MKRGAHPNGEESPRLRAALDRLYAAAPDAFTTLRAELAREAKAAGDATAAARIAKARRPNRVAWAINRLAREDARHLREVFAAFDEANAPATKRDAAAWKQAVTGYRDGVAALGRAVREDLESQGVTADAALLRGVTETVQAAAADPAMRAQLLAGHLERPDESSDPLAGLGGPVGARHHAPEPVKEEKATAKTRREAAAREKREREREARAREEAKRAAERARAIERARKQVAAAEEAKTRADRALDEARAALASLLGKDGARA